MNKIKNGNKGFTLLELLVVVLIIGILATIALPQYKLAVLKSKYNTAKDIARVVKEAESRYYMIHNDYTIDFNDLDIEYSNISSNGKTLYFKYGYCDLSWWPKRGILCFINTSPQLAYIDVFYGKQTNTDRRSCRVLGIEYKQTNSLSDKLCQQETGRRSPTAYGEGTNYYFY